MSSMLMVVASCALGQPGAPVVHLSFDSVAPYVADVSGRNFHALVHGAPRPAEGPRAGKRALVLGDEAWLELPEARILLGERCERGSLALWVRPDFDPAGLAAGTWEGWVTLVYLQKRSSNGLPDGYNEIGLALHGPQLRAKVVAGEDTGPFASVPCPLRQGEWTHLAMTWTPERRCLYVDGGMVAERKGQFQATVLDDFPAEVGRHPSSGRWFLAGAVADVRIYADALSEAEVGALAE